MITVVCWTWPGERIYKPEYVNTLCEMLAQHLHAPHQLVCITDDRAGFAPSVELMPVPEAALNLAEMITPEGRGMPSCYRRLWMFSDEARCLGQRVLLLDVDLVITRDITHLVWRDEGFVGWRPTMKWGNHARVAGGMYLLTPGSRTEVWSEFSPDGVAAAVAAGYRGSDQAWLSYKLGASAAVWSSDAGLYALSDLQDRRLPSDACTVQFAGHVKPWSPESRRWPWVGRYYRVAPEQHY